MGCSITLSLAKETVRVELETFRGKDNKIRYKGNIIIGRDLIWCDGTVEHKFEIGTYNSDESMENTIENFRYVADALEKMHKTLKEGAFTKWESLS